jgi:hypothetical protein
VVYLCKLPECRIVNTRKAFIAIWSVHRSIAVIVETSNQNFTFIFFVPKKLIRTASSVMLETLAFKRHARLVMYHSKQASNGGIKIIDRNKHKSGHFEIMFTRSVL